MCTRTILKRSVVVNNDAHLLPLSPPWRCFLTGSGVSFYRYTVTYLITAVLMHICFQVFTVTTVLVSILASPGLGSMNLSVDIFLEVHLLAPEVFLLSVFIAVCSLTS